MSARVLTVAGSDPSGGAGIQADIKTITALGGYGASVVTALTAQDTRKVHKVVEVEPDFVAYQMRVVIDDIGVDSVKTGMMCRGEVIEAVTGILRAHAPGVPLVVDPVMVSSSGTWLYRREDLPVFINELVPMASVVTPNIHEAGALTGFDVSNPEQMGKAAHALVEMGAGAALVTGGHLPGTDILDVLVWREGTKRFRSRRIQTQNTHGTGCTLASAIATGLAFGLDLTRSVEKARQYLRLAIKRAPGYGSGHGPLNHALSGVSHRASEETSKSGG